MLATNARQGEPISPAAHGRCIPKAILECGDMLLNRDDMSSRPQPRPRPVSPTTSGILSSPCTCKTYDRSWTCGGRRRRRRIRARLIVPHRSWRRSGLLLKDLAKRPGLSAIAKATADGNRLPPGVVDAGLLVSPVPVPPWTQPDSGPSSVGSTRLDCRCNCIAFALHIKLPPGSNCFWQEAGIGRNRQE